MEFRGMDLVRLRIAGAYRATSRAVENPKQPLPLDRVQSLKIVCVELIELSVELKLQIINVFVNCLKMTQSFQLLSEFKQCKNVIFLYISYMDQCILKISEDEWFPCILKLANGDFKLLLSVHAHLGTKQHDKNLAHANFVVVLIL
jgi:hypothetical protein